MEQTTISIKLGMAKSDTPQNQKAPQVTTEENASSHNTRRDFLLLASGAAGAAGIASIAYPFVKTLVPAADTRAAAEIEVDLSKIEVGQSVTVMWRGKPIFIRHRTPEEIAEAEDVDLSQLPDPEADKKRVEKPQWLVVIGVCTHLGCVPTGQKPTDYRGDYDGWFCPCHGSVYDTSGRIRKGPAPKNLYVPPYIFLNDTTIRIGQGEAA